MWKIIFFFFQYSLVHCKYWINEMYLYVRIFMCNESNDVRYVLTGLLSTR